MGGQRRGREGSLIWDARHRRRMQPSPSTVSRPSRPYKRWRRPCRRSLSFRLREKARTRTGGQLLTQRRSWLELPEALTALLIPLPFLFASLAYPHVRPRLAKYPSTLSEAVAESGPVLETHNSASHSQLLHALALSAATLLLVGIVARIASSLQPLDRRKAEKSVTFDIKTAPKRIAYNILSVLLPFYASTQLGGAKTALGLLVAVAGGVGVLDQKPGKHTPWDDMRRTLRTRKATCGALLLAVVADVGTSKHVFGVSLGYCALIISIALVPPPLPTTGLSIKTTTPGQGSYVGHETARASLPKPSSVLVSSFENQILTLASGLFLTVVCILYSLVSSTTPSLSLYALGINAASVASAAALINLSLPASLRSEKHIGLALGCLLVTIVNIWQRSLLPVDFTSYLFPQASIALVGAIVFDTRSSALSTSHSHSHGHSHAGHGHSHEHQAHHLHGNHSRLSAFLISRATPGSIVHSILIEKDSRRIAYFGV
jgi:zinc transporter 5/7